MSDRLKTLNIEKIAALKAGDRTRKDILVLIINEANVIGKAALDDKKKPAPRTPNDNDVIQALERTIKKARETKDILEKNNAATTIPDSEIAVAQEFLPRQMTREALAAKIIELAGSDGVSNKNRGVIMKTLKEQHTGEYDASMANEIIGSLMAA